MTEQQQYRVIADRDKGDNPVWQDILPGDRYVLEHVVHFSSVDDDVEAIIRIERPVPTTDEPHAEMCALNLARFRRDGGAPCTCRPASLTSPYPPTREQIAEAIYTVRAGSNQNWHKAAFRDDYLKEADAVLALIQNGADR